MLTDKIIEVKSISKSYGDIKSLIDVSFSIGRGEIFGLLGPNGAGKSTTVNILNSLLKPDSGEVYINGLNIYDQKDDCKMIMGVVPQEIALYENLSAYDNLLFWGGLYNVPMTELKEIARDILGLVGLSGRKNDRIRTFSGGMKRRINIACALLHKPELLVMDEPTTGVDPQNRNHIFELIERLNSEGMTIIYTTHYMEEAERLCKRIAIIDGGQILVQGTLNELKDTINARDIITVRYTGVPGIDFSNIIPSKPIIIDDGASSTLVAECKGVNNAISNIVSRIENAGGIIESIDTRGSNLESIFLKLTGKNLRD